MRTVLILPLPHSAFAIPHFIDALVEQLESSPPCHGGGRGFKSRLGRCRELARVVFPVAACKPVVTKQAGWTDERFDSFTTH